MGCSLPMGCSRLLEEGSSFNGAVMPVFEFKATALCTIKSMFAVVENVRLSVFYDDIKKRHHPWHKKIRFICAAGTQVMLHFEGCFFLAPPL